MTNDPDPIGTALAWATIAIAVIAILIAAFIVAVG